MGLMLTAALLFALMNFLARLASATSSWALVGAVRAFVGAGVALAVARVRGAPLRLNDKKSVLLRSAFGTAAMAATFYALSSKTLSLGDTVTLLNLTPVFLAILAPMVLGERTSGAVVLAIAVSLGGVVLILHPAFVFGTHEGSDPAIGTIVGPSAAMTALAAASAALLASFAMMMLRRAGRTESSEAIAFHYSLIAAVSLGIFGFRDARIPSTHDAALMIGAGVSAGFAQIAMTRAYSLARAARVSGIGYVTVVASALLGALALRERPTSIALVGMLLVIAGGLLVTFAREPDLI